MSDLEMEPQAAGDDARLDRWRRVSRLERLLGRIVMGVGIGALVVGFVLANGERMSLRWALALVGAFAVSKVVVLVAGLSVRWPAWPAVVMELGAIGVVGAIAALGSAGAWGVPLVALVAVLLMGAGMFRRRAAGTGI